MASVLGNGTKIIFNRAEILGGRGSIRKERGQMTKIGIMARATLGLVLASSQAGADTDHFYTGQTCESANNDSGVVYSSNGVYNSISSGAEKYVWCPVSAIENSFVDLDGAEMSVYNGSTSTQITCTIYIRDYTGAYYTSSALSSYTGSTGYATLSWAPANLPYGGSTIVGVDTYAFYCSLPNTSTGTFFLRNYMVHQALP
jgi:hypothetical protein